MIDKLKLFLIKNINIISIVISIALAFYFIIYIFLIPIFFIICLVISGGIIFYLGRKKNKFGIYISILLVFFNIILLLFLLTPTYNKEINVKGFYKDKKSVIEIEINDSNEFFKDNNVFLRVLNTKNGQENRIIFADIDNKYYKQDLDESGSYKLYFTSKLKKIDSLVKISLRDGTILRLLPQSVIDIKNFSLNQENVLESKTNIELSKGTVWFNVIKTILNDEGFKVVTNNGTIAIRGTSGIVSVIDDKTETIVYSNDHIIEVTNNFGERNFVKPKKVVKIEGRELIDESKTELDKIIESYLLSVIPLYSEIDNRDILKFKNSFYEYVKENFGWEYEYTEVISSLGEMKLNFLSYFSDKYKKRLINYQKYRAIIGKRSNLDNIRGNIEELIIVPLNDELENLRDKYLNDLKGLDIETMKTKIINSLNKLADQGIDIEQEIDDFKSSIDNGKLRNYRNKVLNSLY